MLRKHLWYIVLGTSVTSFISISLAFLPHPFPWMPWDFSILQGCPYPALSSLDGITWFATSLLSGDFPGCSDSKSICLHCRRTGFDSWVGKIPWRRERLPTPEFWPGEFHELYSPWVAKSRTQLSDFTSHFQQKPISHVPAPRLCSMLSGLLIK